MRRLLTLKLWLLLVGWTLICAVLYGLLSAGEAVVEIGAGVAGAPVGQGGNLVALTDLIGDGLQFGLGLMWLAGLVGLWVLRRLVVSPASRAAAAGFAAKGASRVAPMMLKRHPLGRAAMVFKGPAGQLLARMTKRRSQ